MNPFFNKTIHATALFILCAFFFLLAAGSLFAPVVHAAEVRLAWDPPDSNAIDGFKIYYIEADEFEDESSFQEAWVERVPCPETNSCTIIDLEEGQTYYFAATSYRENPSGDSDFESAYSERIMYTVPGEYQGDGTGGDEIGGSGGCFIGIAGGSLLGILSD